MTMLYVVCTFCFFYLCFDHYVNTVKKLKTSIDTISCLNGPDVIRHSCARGPGFDFRLWQGFICLLFLGLLLLLWFKLFSPKHIFVMNICNYFFNVVT